METLLLWPSPLWIVLEERGTTDHRIEYRLYLNRNNIFSIRNVVKVEEM